jgi:hypothetical protein
MLRSARLALITTLIAAFPATNQRRLIPLAPTAAFPATKRRRFTLLATILTLIAAFSAIPSATAATPDCKPTNLHTGEVDQHHAATLLFIPGPVRTPRPFLTFDVEQLPGFGVSLMSATLGKYSPVQTMLDISQGARIASSAYVPIVPQQPALVKDGANLGHFLQWPDLVHRADSVPGEIIPGLLGCSVTKSGMRSGWYAANNASTLTAIAAADTAGTVRGVQIHPERSLTSELLKGQKLKELVVGILPQGPTGLGIVRKLAAQDPDRLIVLVQNPPDPARARLLTIGVRGVGGEGGLVSTTTRRRGLVSATDIAPTILERLRIERSSQMQGQPIEGAPAMSADQLSAMNDRLALVAGRRGPLGSGALFFGGLIVLFLLLLGRLTGQLAETRRLTQRVLGLAIFWLPVLLLITAALRPSRQIETDIAIAGSFLLAYLTDRLVAWPRALWVPSLATVLAHAFDFLVFSGRLTGESLLGSNPMYGARFFGVGNELEAVITVSCVVGAGCFLHGRRTERAAWWFAGIGVALALFLGAGRLGADVGGVIFAGAAFGAAALYAAQMRFTPWRIALLIALPIAGLVLIAGLDAVTGGQSHLTRTIFEADGFGSLVDVADRRFSASIQGAREPAVRILILLSIVTLVVGWWKRERIFARLSEGGESAQDTRPLLAGILGAVTGTVIGAVANDSGPAILIIGTIYTAFAVLYLRGRPLQD